MEQNFKEERKLTGQQESILEGLYGVKTMFIKEAIFQSKATLKTWSRILFAYPGTAQSILTGNAMHTKEGDKFKSLLDGAEYAIKKIVNRIAVLESRDGKRQLLTEIDNLSSGSFYQKIEWSET